MKRAAAAIVVVAGLAAASLAVGRMSAAEPSAGDIVARSVAARGGLDAWRRVDTMVWVGHIETARAPMPDVRFVMELKRPNKTRLEIHADGARSVRVFDGAHGWKLRAGRGRPEVQPYTPQEARFAQAGPGIEGPIIGAAANRSAVKLVSLDQMAGRKAHHLKVRLANGNDEDVWVDAETYLEIRHDRTADDPSGASRRVSVTYGDYRNVEGLMVPFLVETGGGGASADRMKIETVVLNAPLDDSTFGNPVHHPRSVAPGAAPRAPAPTAPSSAPAAASEGPGAAPR
jgi:hypothetical protein